MTEYRGGTNCLAIDQSFLALTMIEEFGRHLIQSGFLPHGYCLSWSPPLVGLYIVSDVLIFLAYFSMPVAIGYFARRRPDFPYPWLLWMFAAFISACGLTHLMGTIVLWQPLYWLDAILKAITATISIVTAVVLWPMIPKALRVPSLEQMRSMNQELSREIASRRQAEAELRRANEELTTLYRLKDASLVDALHRLDAHIGNSPLAIIEFDAEFRITRWSETAETLFGWQANEVVGRAISDLTWVPPEDLEAVSRISAQMLSGTEPRNKHSNRNYRKDGSVVHCEWYNSAIYDEEGRMISILSQVLDVTERIRAEEKLRALTTSLERRIAERTTELSAANKELEGFTYAASHDLKGPLGRIRSFAHLLGQRYRDRLEGEGLQFLDFIHQNAHRLTQLVDDLLSHARITQQSLDLQPVDVRSLVEDLLVEGSEEIGQLHAEVGLELQPAQVLADALSLQQVFKNLLENALKYSGQVNPPRIVIGGTIVDGRYRLSVKDNGIGFDMRYGEQIFEIFRRLHTYQEIPGNGIGLALVRRATERMGGKVWAESAVGQGSTFFLDLQLATDNQAD